ncbi:hypothetical protein O181_000586 [Austropuccinia psidii MF-1]|uniref:Uncharacterized protein n=1 Tax=Austropuccinia psidii MF-1 TaxID=1389203 RepID=A0A9Q3GBQ0_9BASI|nr:hypothetical protein [Austropuccinia psidii MF-1]
MGPCCTKRQKHKELMGIIEEDQDPVSQRGNWIQVGKKIYNAMFQMVTGGKAGVCRVEEFPHPPGSRVLSDFAILVRAMIIRQTTKASSMPPNNLVIYKSKGHFEYGFIKGIYNFSDNHQKMLTGIYVQKIHNVYPKLQYPPGHIGYYLQLLGVTIGTIEQDEFQMISPSKIVSLAAYRLFDNEVFRVSNHGVILCPSNRQLSGFF